MPILNRAAEMQEEVAGWRRRLHQNPELNFDVFETAAFVTEKLKAFGCDEVVTGLGKTGVVGIIRGRRGDGSTIGIQPAEEGGGGGNEMVKDGMMDRFSIAKVFGMHNMPGLPVGQFALKPGAIMAATAEFTIRIKGRGGHAAMPHGTIDPVVIGSQLVGALQTIASRNTDPVESLVVSVTKFHAGDAYNVIPETAELAGTVRTLKKEVAKSAEQRLRDVCAGIAATFGAEIVLDYDANYPVTFNHPEETVFAGDVASGIAGEAQVHRAIQPLMGGEDFSYMLEARPGAFIFIGNGDSAGLHHPAYDFNDEVIPHGVSYWVKLAETALAA